jgi:hypothetical protein
MAGRCRKPRKTTSAQPRQLDSATPGIPFEATIAIWWRPKRRRQPNLEELVSHEVTTAAREMAQRLEATDLPAAQDAINAIVGTANSTPNYRLLDVSIQLELSLESREILAQRQADAERIRRLRFLKEHLYGDPALLVLDQIEHRSVRPEDDEIEYLERLARKLLASERWWFPLLEQWECLGKGFSDTEMQARAMQAILDSLAALKND